MGRVKSLIFTYGGWKWKLLSRAWLCDGMDYTVCGILQARILEWVADPFSRDLPNPGIKPRSPALQVDSLLSEPPGKPMMRKWSPKFRWQVRAQHKQSWSRRTLISRSSWHLLVNMLFYAVRSETQSGYLSLRHLGWACTEPRETREPAQNSQAPSSPGGEAKKQAEF